MASNGVKDTIAASNGSTLAEFNDTDYFDQVLSFQGGPNTEEEIDRNLAEEAAILGVEVAPPITSYESLYDSTGTVQSRHARTGSSASQASVSTNATSRSSTEDTKAQNTSFDEYDQFIQQLDLYPPLPSQHTGQAPSLFSVSTKKSYSSIKDGIKNRFRMRRNKSSITQSNSCICCRAEFQSNDTLYPLPCNHKYCEKCLRILIQQASAYEDKFPPKCCSRGIPSATLKAVLSETEQNMFKEAITQYTTPYQYRIYCPSISCGAFILPKTKPDPRSPFTVVCQRCRAAACSICKQHAHEIGQDCPSDFELEAVSKMDNAVPYRRCYKCRALVELPPGASNVVCVCKAHLCTTCGAVWDNDIGCPNYCTGEEELERRRLEEEIRNADLAAEKQLRDEEEAKAALQLAVAKQHTADSDELQFLQMTFVQERDRFVSYERKMKWVMWTRHGQAKLDILDKYGDLQLKLKEKHVKTLAHLEDRQVAAEMELRATLKQAEKSVQIRLRHMEAYCDGLGRTAAGSARVVTERDLIELGRQYNIRDDMERLHESKVNVMREKQAKQMEAMLSKQEDEDEKLRTKQEGELDTLEETFAQEEAKFLELFALRKEKMKARWVVQGDIERAKLGKLHGIEFAALDEIEWPSVVQRSVQLEVLEEGDD